MMKLLPLKDSTGNLIHDCIQNITAEEQQVTSERGFFSRLYRFVGIPATRASTASIFEPVVQ